MLIKAGTMPDDIVLVLFGGSGSEIEVCRNIGRHFISAEIDEKYHKMILDRLKKGRIEQKYKLESKKHKTIEIEQQLTLLSD